MCIRDSTRSESQLSVCFVDIVGYTTQSRSLDDAALVEWVDRFEQDTTTLVVDHGGQVIKTIGDEVLYQAVDPRSATLIAHDLVRQANDDPMLPPLRVGVATGRVLLRLGDVYGDTVNRAARLTTSAAAGAVLTDRETAAALGHDPAWRFAQLPTRVLHGVGSVTPHHLLSVPPGASAPENTTLGESE